MQARLVEDLLDISRITAGKLRLEMRQFDLAALAPAGGSIRLELKRLGEIDEIIVSDTGVGIEPRSDASMIG